MSLSRDMMPAWELQAALEQAESTITRLRAENERLRVENVQMTAALGYGILAEDERHILPTNPFKCGTCDASKHLRAENERMRAALQDIIADSFSVYAIQVARAALGDTHE